VNEAFLSCFVVIKSQDFQCAMLHYECQPGFIDSDSQNCQRSAHSRTGIVYAESNFRIIIKYNIKFILYM